MSLRFVALTLIAIASSSQAAVQQSTPPALSGETLDGKAITLREAAAGKVTLLVIGASKKAGDRTGIWREHFASDFGSNPHVAYYTAALLESAPSFVRGMIKAGMRSGTPQAVRSHVIVSTTDEAAWKKFLDLKDDKLPAVLLLDDSGHVDWSYNGVFAPDRYDSLKTATYDLLKREP